MPPSPSVLAIDGNASHDASVTVVRDGELFAVECERLDRVKKSGGYRFTVERTETGLVHHVSDHGNLTSAIAYCLELAGLQQVDHLIHTGDRKFLLHLELERYLAPGGKMQRFPSHHLAHACSAFYYSPFERAAVLVVDGSGPEGGTTEMALQSSYFFDGATIRALRRTVTTDEHQLGIGLNYWLHTKLLGHEEGSIMGLSSYGNAARFPQSMLYEVDGHIHVDPRRLPRRIATSGAGADDETLLSHYGLDAAEVRAAQVDIERGVLADVAARLQQETEERLVQLAHELYRATQCKALCLAGGVALNSVANHKILERTPFERIFIQPAAHDGGISLGLALFAHHHLHGAPRRARAHVSLGKEYTNAAIEQVLRAYAAHLHWETVDSAAEVAAELIAEGEIIAWFQGRMEFGPRALGNRSILAHPGSDAMRDRVNDVKWRERWRPLAPAVLEEALPRYFEMQDVNAYMLLVARVTERARREVPAVVHVDGTARPQAVTEAGNPKLHALLRAFEQRTGLPMVLNTSLNSKGEPLIENPEQAVFFLLRSGVDALVIGDFLVRRNPTSSWRPEVVVRHAEPLPGPDTVGLRAALNTALKGIHVERVEHFKGDLFVDVALGEPSAGRSLHLVFEVDGGRVVRILDARRAAPLNEKLLPLARPLADILEAHLTTASPP